MLSVGSQRTLARASSASATQTLACAAATTSGRASVSRRAVARLIGKRRSVGSRGARFIVIPAPSRLVLAVAAPLSGRRGALGEIGKAGGKARAPWTSTGGIAGGGAGAGRPAGDVAGLAAGAAADGGS